MLQDDDQNLDEIEAGLLVTEWELKHEILQRPAEKHGGDVPVSVHRDVSYEHVLPVRGADEEYERQRRVPADVHHNGARHLHVCDMGR